MKKEVIHISNLKKSFGDNTVLDGINLEVQEGENLVVLGRSGSGKSVFVKCIVGLVIPEQGKVEVLGNDVLSMNEKELDGLRKEIGFLFQGAALYDSMSVRDNLAFPLRRNRLSDEEIEKRTEEALDNVGLLDAIDKMPSELSGGMRKRIGLARSLIMQPRIMMYDEPTTGLDLITSKEISALIMEIREKYKTSSVIITHDMPCARITADRIVILKEGRIAAEGTYDELAKSKDEWVRAFFDY